MRLSPAEAEVAALMACGLRNREIAQARGTTLSTAKTQAGIVLRKTRRNRAGLAALMHEAQGHDPTLEWERCQFCNAALSRAFTQLGLNDLGPQDAKVLIDRIRELAR